MLLSDKDIKKEMRKGTLAFSPKLKPGQIGPASVDLTLAGKFWVFKPEYANAGLPVDLAIVPFTKAVKEIRAKAISLESGQMCLGITKEKIRMPDYLIGMLEGRSRYARMGLAVHITSALVQPGSNNHQVLEIVNMAPFPISIREGMRISQIVFERLESPTSHPYAKFGKVAAKQ